MVLEYTLLLENPGLLSEPCRNRPLHPVLLTNVRPLSNDSLNVILASRGCYLFEPTAGRSTEFPWLLGAASDGGKLLDVLLGDGALLPGPLGALGVGRVPAGLVLALLLGHSQTLDNIVLNLITI